MCEQCYNIKDAVYDGAGAVRFLCYSKMLQNFTEHLPYFQKPLKGHGEGSRPWSSMWELDFDNKMRDGISMLTLYSELQGGVALCLPPVTGHVNKIQKNELLLSFWNLILKMQIRPSRLLPSRLKQPEQLAATDSRNAGGATLQIPSL